MLILIWWSFRKATHQSTDPQFFQPNRSEGRRSWEIYGDMGDICFPKVWHPLWFQRPGSSQDKVAECHSSTRLRQPWDAADATPVVGMSISNTTWIWRILPTFLEGDAAMLIIFVFHVHFVSLRFFEVLWSIIEYHPVRHQIHVDGWTKSEDLKTSEMFRCFRFYIHAWLSRPAS